MRPLLLHRPPARFTPVAATALLFCVLTGTSFAQSTDPQNPTPLASGEIQGTSVEQKTTYYYTFAGGPGTVSATLEAKSKKGAKSASVGIELIDKSARSLASTLLNEGLGGGKDQLGQLLNKGLGRITSGLDSLTGGTQQKTTRIKLKEKQNLTLRLTVGQGIESYTVRLEGAVEFGQAATAADPAEAGPPAAEATAGAENPAPTAEQPATPESQPATAEQVAPDEQQPAATESAPPSGNQPPAMNPKPAIIKIPGRKAQAGPKPAIVKIPGKKTQP
jgi:hypothetical protein